MFEMFNWLKRTPMSNSPKFNLHLKNFEYNVIIKIDEQTLNQHWIYVDQYLSSYNLNFNTHLALLYETEMPWIIYTSCTHESVHVSGRTPF